MGKTRTCWLITNAASGSNDADAVDRLAQELAAAGAAPQRTITLPDDVLPERPEIESAGVELLVIFTGDGTANATIAGLAGWGGEVLILPGGTQNLLARSLHGEKPTEEIIAALGRHQLEPRRPGTIRSRHGDALCEIVAGPGASWSDVREALREGAVGELASAATEAIAQTTAGPTVVVAEPALGKPEGYPAVRLYPKDGAIAVDGYGADTLADYARAGLAILQRNFREGPHDELGLQREVVCRSDDPIELMIDGERVTGETEERFTLAPCGVTLLASPVTETA
jgi:diacylglycerol kinase family enzyme